jgi:hypothetical protein
MRLAGRIEDFMHQDHRATEKKPYSSPRFIVLDEKIAKARLTDAGDLGDQTMQRMPLWPEKQSKAKNPVPFVALRIGISRN